MISKAYPVRKQKRCAALGPGLFSLLLGALMTGGAVLAAPRMPRGAFLRSPAPTADALKRQVASDPLVLTRYAHVFAMSPSAVRRSVAQMRLQPLAHDQILEVHYVHAGEKIGYRLRRLRKGALVYVLPDGAPVLAQVCGNPLRSTLSLNSQMALVDWIHPVPDFEADMAPPAPASSRGNTRVGSLRTAEPETEWEGSGGDEDSGEGEGGGPGTTGGRIAGLPILWPMASGLASVAEMGASLHGGKRSVNPRLTDDPNAPVLIGGPGVETGNPPGSDGGNTPPGTGSRDPAETSIVPEPGILTLAICAMGSGLFLTGAVQRAKKQTRKPERRA